MDASTPTYVALSQTMPGHLGREEQLMADHAERLGIPVVLGSVSMMERGRISLETGALVAGTVSFVLHALRHLKIPVPSHTPYPSALRPWLGRQVAFHARLADVLDQLRFDGTPTFIKPASGWKRFTGFVARFPDDPRFNGASRRKPVWTSEPLELVSEWRAYVARNEILALKFADDGGDRAATPDGATIARAVHALGDAGQAPAAYVIDFGVDRQGRTVLIELNDGFAFGAYDGLDAATYWAVTAIRWQQLLNAR